MCPRKAWFAVLTACGLAAVPGLASHRATRAAEPLAQPGPAAESEKIVPLRKSDAEWRKLLSRRQFAVTRRKETEDPYSGKLLHNKRQGTYQCVCCELALFDSGAKYDSRTGWPSFWRPLERAHVGYAIDDSQPPRRIEVKCARCDAHLGHVFNDGPAPTGLRYCINSAALSFAPRGDAPQDKSKKRSVW